MAAPPNPGAGKTRLDWLIDALALIAGVSLCVLTAIICLDVASRNLRLFATPWTLDVAEYLLYGITFLGAPWVLREGGHISIDIVVDRLEPRARRRTAYLTHAIGAVVCAVLLYYASRVWWRSFWDGTLVHETFVFPEWYLLSMAPPIFLILLLVFLRWILHMPAIHDPEPPSDGM